MSQGASSAGSGHRIVFLDYLRALAVLLVLWGHLFIVGVNNPDSMAPWLPGLAGNVFGPSVVFTNPHGQLDLFFMLRFGISSGPLGVAIFFLISGFVILRSVDSIPPPAFLIQRAFRIFPTCAAVVVGVALLTALYGAATGTAQPHSLASVAASSFALSGFFGVMGTLPVLWSLTVELLFYVLIAASVAIVGRLGFRALLGMAIIFLVAVGVLNSNDLAAMISPQLRAHLIYVSSLLIHVIFMLVGSALYRGMSDGRPVVAALVGAAIFVVYLGAYALYGHLRGAVHIGATPNDAVAALAIMVAAYWAGMSWRWLRPLRFVADISYPLYLVHTPLGWVALLGLGAIGWNLHAAALGAALFSVMLAWGLHVAIELPSQRLGKVLTRRWKAPAAPRTGQERLVAALYPSEPAPMGEAKRA